MGGKGLSRAKLFQLTRHTPVCQHPMFGNRFRARIAGMPKGYRIEIVVSKQKKYVLEIVSDPQLI